MKHRSRWAALAAVFALVLAACGGGDAGDEETTTTAGGETTTTASSGGGDLSGRIEVSGSSTVEPITALVAETFSTDNPGVAISVEGPGTGDGFVRFCNGETDISDASRPIKDEEVENCAANGVEFVELLVAIDGLSVITSVENEAVSCLNFGDIYALVGPESEGFANWNDADALAAEVGGNGGFPAAPLVITAPGEESGTYDTFVELAIEDIADERGQDAATRADYQASANDNVIVEGVANNPTSFGWVGYAFYLENAEVLKALQIDGGDGCVEATPETIASGEFPLARPLFIYVSKNRLAESPALEAFVDFYMTDTGLVDAVAETGYVVLDDDDLAATRAAWEGR
jgi:phosphate transport system substrate-binding protein